MKSILFNSMNREATRVYVKPGGPAPPSGVQLKKGARGGVYYELPGGAKPVRDPEPKEQPKRFNFDSGMIPADFPDELIDKYRKITSLTKNEVSDLVDDLQGELISGDWTEAEENILSDYIDYLENNYDKAYGFARKPKTIDIEPPVDIPQQPTRIDAEPKTLDFTNTVAFDQWIEDNEEKVIDAYLASDRAFDDFSNWAAGSIPITKDNMYEWERQLGWEDIPKDILQAEWNKRK